MAALTKLKALSLHGATVEPAGVLRLQAALPNCNIIVNLEIQKAIDEARKTR